MLYPNLTNVKLTNEHLQNDSSIKRKKKEKYMRYSEQMSSSANSIRIRVIQCLLTTHGVTSVGSFLGGEGVTERTVGRRARRDLRIDRELPITLS